MSPEITPAMMEAMGDPKTKHGLRLALLVHPDKCSEIPEAKAWLDVGMISRCAYSSSSNKNPWVFGCYYFFLFLEDA